MQPVTPSRVVAAAGIVLWLVGLARAADPITERVAALRPPVERWQQVGWRTDLDAARREAARLRRPIFIWAMNGNPLGCT